ncbi:MAG: hypothetical protein JXB33_04820 [Clostridia bacterium]|nr:hypothetical protein [Clostridia bacterium]
MKFAQARELITPPIRTTMSGYANRKEEFAGIHDDLYVKAVYIESGSGKLLVVTFDLCHYLYDLNERIFDYASAVYGIPKDNIIINYSHTHAGPKITSPTEKEDPSPLDSFFFERAKTCIDRAFLNIFEGTLDIARTSGRWNVNRRRDTGNGIVMEPNHNGITDDEVVIMVAKDLNGDIRTVFVNYSCHPVTLSGTLFISAEYPGRLCNLLESRFYGAMAVFLQGAAGNMRPLVTADKGKFKACSFDELDEFSNSIANHVVKTICTGEFKRIDPELKAVKFSLNLPTDRLPLSFFQKKLDEDMGYVTKRMKKVVDNYDSMDDMITIHCGIVRFSNDLYLVFMGGEICYEVKQIVQRVFKPADIIFLGYHEAMTYIPDDKIISEGGYEGFDAPANAGFRGPFKPGIDEIIRSAFRQHLDSMA